MHLAAWPISVGIYVGCIDSYVQRKQS